MHRARTAYSVALSPARQRNLSNWLVQKTSESKVSPIKMWKRKICLSFWSFIKMCVIAFGFMDRSRRIQLHCLLWDTIQLPIAHHLTEPAPVMLKRCTIRGCETQHQSTPYVHCRGPFQMPFSWIFALISIRSRGTHTFAAIPIVHHHHLHRPNGIIYRFPNWHHF